MTTIGQLGMMARDWQDKQIIAPRVTERDSARLILAIELIAEQDPRNPYMDPEMALLVRSAQLYKTGLYSAWPQMLLLARRPRYYRLRRVWHRCWQRLPPRLRRRIEWLLRR